MIVYSTDERIAVVERGDYANALLSSDFFHEVIDYLTSYHISAILACRPGFEADKDALNHHHLMQHALTEICGHLKMLAEAGASEAALLAAQQEDN